MASATAPVGCWKPEGKELIIAENIAEYCASNGQICKINYDSINGGFCVPLKKW